MENRKRVFFWHQESILDKVWLLMSSNTSFNSFSVIQVWPRYWGKTLFSKLFRCLMWTVWLLEIIVVIWQWLISTDNGLILQEKIIPQFIILNSWSKEWKKKETCLFIVIFMVIQERKIVSCTVVLKMGLKSSKFFQPL